MKLELVFSFILLDEVTSVIMIDHRSHSPLASKLSHNRIKMSHVTELIFVTVTIILSENI